MIRGTVAGLLLLVTLCVGMPFHSAELSGMFQSYKQKYNRAYSSAAEERKRLQCFVENLRLIEERNRMDTAVHGINDFTDLCPEEFRAMYLGGYVPDPQEQQQQQEQAHETAKHAQGASDPYHPVYPTFDWRKAGAVGPVKNQGKCGSCWTFSAVAAMEGAYNLKYKPSPFQQLSEEYLLECTTGTNFCKGGAVVKAVSYAISSGGVPSEESYPYTSGTGVNGTCSTDPAMLQPVAQFTSYQMFNGTTEPQLLVTLFDIGPLFISVDAGAWHTYTSGILSVDCENRDLNHAVALVGVGIEGSTNYWIIRNSWGPAWGEAGYIYLKFGVNCNGITKRPGAVTAK